ncbi:MAG: ATP-binding protein, partial [Nitrososphaera sp.]|nr:ATP-binding protein [Nitrososphaera sp.]
MTYPYGLKSNPYPSSPTPTEHDARILGGTKHQEAKGAIIECVLDLYKKITRRNSTENDFRLVTVVQDVGSGKTHLALHIKTLKTRQDITTAYVDLSTISPKTNESIYNAIVHGFGRELFSELKEKFLSQISEKAQKGDGLAKRALGYGLGDKLRGVTIKQKAEDILYDKRAAPADALQRYLAIHYSQHEQVIIKNILSNSFDKITNLDELHGRLAAISKFSHNLLGKVILFEMDEFDAQEGSLDFVKSLINAHIPASVLLLITTPSLYMDVQRANPSVFDRLEKANYKIDLAGANSIDELIEIAIEY